MQRGLLGIGAVNEMKAEMLARTQMLFYINIEEAVIKAIGIE